jgi:hypothetical protein
MCWVDITSGSGHTGNKSDPPPPPPWAGPAPFHRARPAPSPVR